MRHDAVNGGGELSGSRRAPSLRGRARPTFRTKDLEYILQNDIIQKEYGTGIVGKASMKDLAAVYTGLDLHRFLPNYENPPRHPHRPSVELPIGGFFSHRHCLHNPGGISSLYMAGRMPVLLELRLSDNAPASFPRGCRKPALLVTSSNSCNVVATWPPTKAVASSYNWHLGRKPLGQDQCGCKR
jgi:hypothetical protein